MVLFANDTITIVNKYTENKVDKYNFTVIEGVNWNDGIKYTVTDKGLNSAYNVTIFMDKLDNYIPPKQFYALENKDGYFTLNKNDRIVLGVVGSEFQYNMKLMSELNSAFDDVVTISAVEKLSNHFEVGCV